MKENNWITKLEPNEIFVFGSNIQGMHGTGAAKQALEFGAIRGIGFGRVGSTYAIPTRYQNPYLKYNSFGGCDLVIEMKTLGLDTIRHYIMQFMREVENYPELTFLVTPIGTGLAGYAEEQILPFFEDYQSCQNIKMVGWETI